MRGGKNLSASADPLRDPCVLQFLESILPFVEFARDHKVPNAAYYVEAIDLVLWSRK